VRQLRFPTWAPLLTSSNHDGARHPEGDQRRVEPARAQCRLENGSGYFYFFGGEATDWIDCPVQATTVNALRQEEWITSQRLLMEHDAGSDSLVGKQRELIVKSNIVHSWLDNGEVDGADGGLAASACTAERIAC
jgi:hypothetical protein